MGVDEALTSPKTFFNLRQWPINQLAAGLPTGRKSNIP